MEIVRVYTRHDIMPNRIMINEERELTKWEVGEMPWKTVSYDAVKIENGLEGVKFVHYSSNNG